MLFRSRVIANGTSDELKDQIGGDRLSVTIARVENAQRAVDALTPLAAGSVGVDPESDGTHILASIRSGDRVVPSAIRSLDRSRTSRASRLRDSAPR